MEESLRGVSYRSGVFGTRSVPENCIDLFIAQKPKKPFKGKIRARVTYPFRGPIKIDGRKVKISAKPTKGMQQCLRFMGFDGLNGKPLDPDNDPGKNTRHAMWCWLGEQKERFKWGVPAYRVPWDSEIYFQVREAVRELVNG